MSPSLYQYFVSVTYTCPSAVQRKYDGTLPCRASNGVGRGVGPRRKSNLGTKSSLGKSGSRGKKPGKRRKQKAGSSESESEEADDDDDEFVITTTKSRRQLEPMLRV